MGQAVIPLLIKALAQIPDARAVDLPSFTAVVEAGENDVLEVLHSSLASLTWLSVATLLWMARTLPAPELVRSGDAADRSQWRTSIAELARCRNVVAKLGPDELKDAMVTLHPQSAMEHLHQRFVAANGKGSDGAIAFEATEVAATQRGRAPVPVRASEPLAGAPDRSPTHQEARAGRRRADRASLIPRTCRHACPLR